MILMKPFARSKGDADIKDIILDTEEKEEGGMI